jgi:hypothetical protein
VLVLENGGIDKVPQWTFLLFWPQKIRSESHVIFLQQVQSIPGSYPDISFPVLINSPDRVMGYGRGIVWIMPEVGKRVLTWIEEIESPAIGTYPDPSPAVLVYFPNGRASKRAWIKGIMIIVSVGSTVRIVARNSMCICTYP